MCNFNSANTNKAPSFESKIKLSNVADWHVQSPLVIVDSSVSLKMSTIMRETAISREIHAKIDSWSIE